jgi:hypothetical protein
MPATTSSAATAIDVARSFFTAYNAHEMSKMVGACSEDAQLRYVPMAARVRAKRARWARPFGQVSSTPSQTWPSPFSRCSVTSGRGGRGRDRRNPEEGFSPDPQPGQALRPAPCIPLEKDLITEIACYWDNASFYLQLGKTTLP